MSFGTDIYGSPFGAPDVEPIDAIAYAQGVVLYVADDFVEDGYIIEPIPVTVSAPAVSAFQVVAGNASASVPQVTASAPEPTLTISQIRVDVDFPAITATAPAVNAGAIRNVIAFTQGIELYVADDFVEDGYAQEPIDVTISVPQVTATTSVDAAAQAAMVTVSLTAAEASATGSATATFGALLVSATAPQGSGVADGSVTVSVASGSLVISSPDPSVSANSSITSTSNTVSITSPDATATGGGTGSATIPEIFVIKPSVYEYATEFPNAIPNVVISAAVATLSAGSSTSVSADTVTSSAPQASVSVNNSVDVTSNTINVSAPVISVTGGTGATANTLGADLYVDANYVDAGYTDDPIEVTITSPDDIVTSQPATANVTIGTVVVSAPEGVSGFGFAATQVSLNTVLITNPEVAASGTASIDVAAPEVNVSSPQVSEVVSEFPLALLPVNVSPAQVNATGTANADIDLVEVQVAAIQAAATGTASVQVTAVTVEVQSPEVLETIDEFPLALPGITVSSPEVSAAGTANTSVSCPSVTASSLEAEISGQGLVVIAEVELTTITTVSPISQANVIVYVAATEVGVNPSAPTVTAVPTAAPTAPAVSVSAPTVQINVVERPEDLQQINVTSPTAAAFEFSVNNLDLLRQIKVENEVRKIILEKEIRVIKVSPVGG